MKKCIAVLLLALAVAFPLLGRGGATSAEAGELELKLIHHFTEMEGAEADAFLEVLETAKSEFADVKFVVEAVQNETLKTKLKTLMAADEVPDLLRFHAAKFAEPFIKAGKHVALDPYLDRKTKSKISAGALSSFTYDGKIYGIPDKVYIGLVYCNTEFFDEYDVEIPEDFDGLIQATKDFKAAGVMPIALSQKDRWPGAIFWEALVARHGGTDVVYEALDGLSYDDPAFLKAARDFRALQDAGAFHQAAAQMAYADANQDFGNRKTAMYINGSWGIGYFKGVEDDLHGNIRLLVMPPNVKGGKGPDHVWGGAGEGWFVGHNTANPERATEVALFMAEQFCVALEGQGLSLTAWKTGVGSDDPLFLRCQEIIGNAKGMCLGWDIMLPPEFVQEYLDNFQAFFMGKKTPEEFVAGLPSQ